MVYAKSKQVKPYIKIGTIGHTSHTRTILLAAISKVLADKYPDLNDYPNFATAESSSNEGPRGIDSIGSQIDYQTEKRHYTHIDTPNIHEYYKNLITGAAGLSGAILVVAATDGPLAQTREEVLLARQAGVPYLVVALDKSDLIEDEELLELEEMEILDLLSSQDYDEENVRIIRVSGLKALEGDPRWIKSIEELLDAIDEIVPDLDYGRDRPFLMAVEDILTIAGRGTVVTGRVERGTLAIDSDVEIVGMRPTQRTTVIGIEMFHKQFSEARAGATYGLLLSGIKREDVERGQVIAEPGSITSHTAFLANVYILTQDEGGRNGPFRSGYRPQFYFRTTDLTGVITLPKGRNIVLPGDSTEINVELISPIAMREGEGFAVREGGRTVASGRVTQILNAPPDEHRTNSATPRRVEERAADPLLARRNEIREAVRLAILRMGVREEFASSTGTLTMELEGRTVLPEFQFAHASSFEVYDIVKLVGPLLGGDSSSLGALSWWMTKNAWIGDAPLELLGAGRDQEILYAAIQIENDNW